MFALDSLMCHIESDLEDLTPAKRKKKNTLAVILKQNRFHLKILILLNPINKLNPLSVFVFCMQCGNAENSYTITE